jgi:hypothetical protein
VPGESAVAAANHATSAPPAIRIADIDRWVDVAELAETGIQVEVIPARGTRLIRFRIFKLTGRRSRPAAAAVSLRSADRRLVATVYRKVTSGGRRRVRLTQRELGRLKPGRYVLEARAGTGRRQLGTPRTTAFTIAR